MIHMAMITSGKYWNVSYSYIVFKLCVYLYVYMWTCFFYYLSNHVNHLFITIQKITMMAIIFKSIMYVYTELFPFLIY